MSNRLNHIGFTQAERIGTWLKALGGNDRARALCTARGIELKAAGESLPGSGGWLVPEDFDSALLAVVEQYSACRKGTDVRTITRDAVTRPRRTGGVTATWLTENTVIPESNMTIDGVSLSMKKLAVLIRSSSDLFYDAASDLGSWFTFETGFAVAKSEDDLFFNGDGSSAYVGTVGLTAKLTGTAQAVNCASTHDTYAEVTGDDVSNCMAQVLGSAITNAAFYMHPLVYGQVICRLSAATGGLVTRLLPDGTLQANYLGFPIYLSGSCNSTAGDGKVVLYFGDAAMASMLVQRHNSTVIATSFDRSMDVDQVLLRAVRREAIVIHSITPMAMLLGKT